jgi:hypothetical protein
METTIANLFVPALAMGALHKASQPVPDMDAVAVLGFTAAFVALVVALYQREARPFVLVMAVSMAGLSAYAFLSGAWPLGIVNGFWSAATLSQWRQRRKTKRFSPPVVRHARHWVCESRMSRMFGNN